MNVKKEIELIHSLKQGNPAAFEMLYRLYSEKVFNLSKLILKDSGWSEDVVQEVFVKIWNYKSTLEEHKNLWAYIYVLTKRLSLNKLRDIQKFDPKFEQLWNNLKIQGDCSHELLVARDLQKKIDNILDGLPERQKEVFMMSRVEGYTHQEIAERLNISPNTVKNHIIQVLKTLKKHLIHLDYIFIIAFLSS